MSAQGIRLYLKQIEGGNPTLRETAFETIYALDEEAITPLLDEFYAGVGEATGNLIIGLVSTIGGYEARQLLEDILSHPQPYTTWKATAQDGMTHT